jgi:acyl-CoA synthetase (NDP forming)/GNAT superfamily N-acetyltransferase
MVKPASQVYALLADGTTVEIRPATPDDFDAVKAMHEAMSNDNTYMRFFNISRGAAEAEARRICLAPVPGNVALLAVAGGEVVGVASYVVSREQARQPADSERTAGPAPSPAPRTAEVAFAVADGMHHRGIATLLLEHLVSWARSRQITTFTAQTLTENRAMLNVFADAGLPVTRRYGDGVYDLSFPLPATAPAAGDEGTALDVYLSAVAERERRAGVASLRYVLAPESVAVIGVSRRPGTAGRKILDNIRAGGYAGRLYAVNPRARQIGGERCLASALDLPEPADLAVIAVPASSVLEVAEQCGQRGVRSLVVVTAGLDAGGCADLLAVCRRHGMRLVGPDGFGVAVPGLGLDATFAARPPRAGVAGLVMQSGGLGFALVDQLSRLGIGISSFVSAGEKLDVSSNDMLLWWEHDGVTRVAVLYIESFGNPRKFARTARRVGAVMPVLTVLAPGRSAAGQQAPVPAGAEAGSPPLASREALFEQAGVITTRGFGELIEATALLATQPVPAGRTVAIVSNVGSAGRLAADACADLGLTVHHPHGLTRQRLLVLTPDHGTVNGPVDMSATVCSEDFRRCLEVLAADEQVHAIIALVLPTGATGDLVRAVQQADVGIPLAAVVLDQAESVRLLPRPGEGQVPAYGYPEAAVAALARAASYGAWRAEPRGRVPDFPGIKAVPARTLVREFLGRQPAGGWLPPKQAADLLRYYGTPLAGGKGDLTDVAAGGDGIPVVVQVAADATFGPLVVFGLGGVSTEVFADRSARLTPLTDTDADRLIRSVRSASLLSGQDGRPAADLGALRDLLLRVSRLADDLPEVVALDLDPVIARPDQAVVVGARIKLAPFEPNDPFLRRLRLKRRAGRRWHESTPGRRDTPATKKGKSSDRARDVEIMSSNWWLSAGVE